MESSKQSIDLLQTLTDIPMSMQGRRLHGVPSRKKMA